MGSKCEQSYAYLFPKWGGGAGVTDGLSICTAFKHRGLSKILITWCTVYGVFVWRIVGLCPTVCGLFLVVKCVHTLLAAYTQRRVHSSQCVSILMMQLETNGNNVEIGRPLGLPVELVRKVT